MHFFSTALIYRDMTKLEKPLIGAEYIRQFAKNLTTKPGVYRMLGEDDKVLYVGKAKNLKNRVTSYATRGVMQNRTLRMVSQTLKMVVITTGSEAEALLLEASLIKQLSPMFNILLKDDKSFPFIELTNHEFPQIRKHRGKQKRGNTYFGPFATVSAMNHTLALLQKAFLLRPCNDTIYKNRSRPCLQYQIKRCSAPCVDRIARGEYDALIEQAKDFLAGKSTEVQQRLAKQMEKLSEEMDYEQAAACRDRIRALTQVQQEQSLGVTNIGDADVIGVYREGGRACVQMFFFRGGQAYGNRALFPARAAEADEKALIAATIGHFYQRYPAPKQLLLSHKPDDMDVIAEALALSSGHAISVSVPQRGDKKQLMEQVIANAKNALALHTAEKMQASASLEGVQKLFALAEAPKRIEVYDNSHISGTNAVGAMVVATPDGFEKKSYRKFSFTDDVINGGDDTAMMREVMMRRLSRLQKEDPDRTSANVPDLLLIDGGKGS